MVIRGLSPLIFCRFNSLHVNVGQGLQSLLNLVQSGFCAMLSLSGVEPSRPGLKGKVLMAGLPGKPHRRNSNTVNCILLSVPFNEFLEMDTGYLHLPKTFLVPLHSLSLHCVHSRQPLICFLVTID